jgi:hypothetical protein
MIEKLSLRVEECKNILLGKTKIRGNEDIAKIENLDEIKYSMNSILRKELQILEELIEYPNSLIKSL